MAALVGIVMGSRSDWETMRRAAETLAELGIAAETRVVSAHRTPDLLMDYATSARDRGREVERGVEPAERLALVADEAVVVLVRSRDHDVAPGREAPEAVRERPRRLDDVLRARLERVGVDGEHEDGERHGGLGGDARVITGAQYDPDTPNKIQKPNKVRGQFADIVDTARLTGNAWYAFADPNFNPASEVVFLDGVETPYLEMQDGFRTDGIERKVRLDYGVGALNFRSANKNPGAYAQVSPKAGPAPGL